MGPSYLLLTGALLSSIKAEKSYAECLLRLEILKQDHDLLKTKYQDLLSKRQRMVLTSPGTCTTFSKVKRDADDGLSLSRQLLLVVIVELCLSQVSPLSH